MEVWDPQQELPVPLVGLGVPVALPSSVIPLGLVAPPPDEELPFLVEEFPLPSYVFVAGLGFSRT